MKAPKKNMAAVISMILLLFFSNSCVVVQEYEKINLSDPDMELSSKSIDRFQINFQVYREAASGANGGKTGGGCGCN